LIFFFWLQLVVVSFAVDIMLKLLGRCGWRGGRGCEIRFGMGIYRKEVLGMEDVELTVVFLLGGLNA